MATDKIEVTKTDSILNQFNELQTQISQRAYDLFRNSEGFVRGAIDDWLRAERELVWRPAIDLRQKDGRIELEAALSGVEPKNLDVQVTPEDVLITAKEEQHRHDQLGEKVHVCEFGTGRLFRSVHLPERIDVDSVEADFSNGLLHLSASVAGATPKKVDVKAA